MKKFLFRPHRGSLCESMDEVIEIDSREELVKHLNEDFPYGSPVTLKSLDIQPYGFDDRIGWDTHIVTVNKSAVGFTNGNLK